MSFRIAITGKGGTGKTTVAGILIARLVAKQRVPVLAIDADPNICLDQVLGVSVNASVGSIREEARFLSRELEGVSKREMLELKIAESLIESDDFDLIAMGRPEGPGCYCYANNVLRDVIQTVASSYPFLVIDNEAGLENLSRRIIKDVDILIMVGDPSKRGIETIKRLKQLSDEMEIAYKKLIVIINKVRQNKSDEDYQYLKNELNADEYLIIPDNDEISEFAEEGKIFQDLSADSIVANIIDEFITNNIPKV